MGLFWDGLRTLTTTKIRFKTEIRLLSNRQVKHVIWTNDANKSVNYLWLTDILHCNIKPGLKFEKFPRVELVLPFLKFQSIYQYLFDLFKSTSGSSGPCPQ